MSVTHEANAVHIHENNAIDFVEVINRAYEIGDMINASYELQQYINCKQEMENDKEAQRLIQQFHRVKDKFHECERFGHYHPDYHKALEEVQRFQEVLEQNETIRRFKQAEHAVDTLLYEVSKTIAYAVSEDIKVPSNQVVETVGCSAGGRCSGNCG